MLLRRMATFIAPVAVLALAGSAWAARDDEYRFTDAESPPSWAIPYGDEFWRRSPTVMSGTGSARTELGVGNGIDIHDVMDRVSHALAPAEAGTSPLVNARRFLATLEGGGVQMAAHAPGAPPDRLEYVTFRSRAVTQGGTPLWTAAEPASTWIVTGNVAQAELAPDVGLVEHHEVLEEGVEITWILGTRPSGRGPLVIEADVEGLAYAGTTGEGLRFAGLGEDSAVVLRSAVGIDSTGARWDLPLAFDRGVVRIEASSELLDAAVFPLAIDPTIGPELSLLQAAPGDQLLAAVASNGTDFLVVWHDYRNGAARDIYGARVTNAGTVLDKSGIAITLSPADDEAVPAVASAGGDYLVVWVKGCCTIQGALVRASDGLTMALGADIEAHPNSVFAPAVAGSGSRYLVVWDELVAGNYDIHAKPIDINGALQQERTVADAAQSLRDSSVAALGDAGLEKFLVTWTNETLTQVHAVRTDRSGIPGTSFRIDTTGNVDFAEAASDGSDYLVTWLRDQVAADEVRSVYVPASEGSPLGTEQTIASGAVGPPSVAWHGTNYLAAFSSADDIYAGRVAADGSLVGAAFAVSSDTSQQLAPKLASNGTYALVAWDDNRQGSLDIYARRVQTDGTVVGVDGLVSSDGIDVGQQNPALTNNSQFYLLAWQALQNGRAEVFAARVFIGTGVIKDPAGIRIPMPSDPYFSYSYPDVASDGTDFLLTWWTAYYGLSFTFHHVDGTLLRGANIDVPAILPVVTIGDTAFDRLPAVAWRGSNFFVGWQSNSGASGWDVRGNWVKEASGGGTLQVGPRFNISSASADQIDVDVVGSQAHRTRRTS